MDAIEKLVWDSDISAAVLGKGVECVLIPLDQDGVPLSDAVLEEAKAKGFEFAGVLGYINGVASAKCVNPEGIGAMMAATVAFAHYVTERLKPAKTDDSVSWLESLFRLEDPRGRN